ncbi:hypothetical protein [Pseudonocardia sp. ICBG601]|uniref:hypothetical protein n=1 Tax=Pseudonocardia sp. ICBG601 TaxID=2846759 RepID=UPI001CF686F7|nr:hypothetical protein [Pseudonocardia sp. ICBG601]
MVILPYRFPKPDVFALFIDTEDRDLFLIEPDTDPDLRDHNLGHEIGHCLLGHRCGSDEELIREIFPTLSPSTVRGSLRRARFATRAEMEAEEVAFLLVPWVKSGGQARKQFTSLNDGLGTSRAMGA